LGLRVIGGYAYQASRPLTFDGDPVGVTRHDAVKVFGGLGRLPR